MSVMYTWKNNCVLNTHICVSSIVNRIIQACWWECLFKTPLRSCPSFSSDYCLWITPRIKWKFSSTTTWVLAPAASCGQGSSSLHAEPGPSLWAPSAGGLSREAHPEVLGGKSEHVQRLEDCGTGRKFEPRRSQEHGPVGAPLLLWVVYFTLPSLIGKSEVYPSHF